MAVVQYLLGILLGSAGVWVICVNWRIFWTCHVRKRHSPSWLPILGGLLVGIAFVIWPKNPVRWLAWVAFVLDWGSVPGIGYSIYWHLARRRSL